MTSYLKQEHKNCEQTTHTWQKVFIAVHAGAGNHSKSNESIYKDVCQKACVQAMKLLKDKKSAVEAVAAAVAVLEDDSCTNAGVGSTLTLNGTVECDASLMDGGSLLFGAVGALEGVQNPVRVAQTLVQEQKLGPLPAGRIRPSILVGPGAQAYAREKDFDVRAKLTTAQTLKTYSRYRRKCEKAELASAKRQKLDTDVIEKKEVLNLQHKEDKTYLPNNDRNVNPQDEQEITTDLFVDNVLSDSFCTEDGVQDTVGAVCVDSEGNVAAASSSGGIWLKHAGRLGPAALYGSGCWAQNQTSSSKAGVAGVTSGCGEHLIQTFLARTCCDAMRCPEDMTEAVAHTFKEQFMDSEFLASNPLKYGGALLLKVSSEESNHQAEVGWVHSTASMCVGFMGDQDTRPTTVMSRLEDQTLVGKSFTLGGKGYNLSA